MKSLSKHINKIIVSLTILAIASVAASVVKVERIDEKVIGIQKEMTGNDKAHERLEKKIDLILNKLIEN